MSKLRRVWSTYFHTERWPTLIIVLIAVASTGIAVRVTALSSPPSWISGGLFIFLAVSYWAYVIARVRWGVR